MNIRDISEVGVRLEKAIAASFGDCSSPLEKYELYEHVAIQILDSEHMDFPDGALETYLTEYLARKRQELGLEFD